MVRSAADRHPPNTCVTCGERLQGPFCHACGEKRTAESDRTVRHFVRDVLGSALNLDGTFWRTLRLLVFNPGALTAEHIAGRRRPYLTPLRLFLLCNLLYFVVQPHTGFSGYNTDLRSQIVRQGFSKIAGLTGRVAERIGVEVQPYKTLVQTDAFRAYEPMFNRQSSTYARSLVILLIPLLALLLKVLLPRRPLADHLVMATHVYAWQLLVIMSLWLLLYRMLIIHAVLLLPDGIADYVNETHTFWFVAVYLYFALRTAYGLTWQASGWRALAVSAPPVLFSGFGFAGLLVFVLLFYRYLLFWLTFWTVAPF